MRKKDPIPFSQKFPNAGPLALDLLQRLLAFDPKDRPTAEQVIKLFYMYSSRHPLFITKSGVFTLLCVNCYSSMTFFRHWLIHTLKG